MTRMVKDQGGLTQINKEDFHTCMFAFFLSQEKSKRVHQGKAADGNVQKYVLLPLWSSGSKDPYNTDADATFEVKEPKSEVHVSPSSSAKTKEHDDKTKREAKGKIPVELSTGVRNLSKAADGNVQKYVLLPLWSSGSKDPYNTDADATFEVKEPKSEVHVSPSSSAKTKEHDDKTKREAKGKIPVELSTGVRNLSEEFEDFSSNSTNEVNAAST
nr:hypothetical protein [Tanacetum cinerariifolium]